MPDVATPSVATPTTSPLPTCNLCAIASVLSIGELKSGQEVFHCGDCDPSEFSKCDNCDDFKTYVLYTLHNGDLICEDCYDDSYFTCEKCDEIRESQDATNVHGVYVCPDCFDEYCFSCYLCGHFGNLDESFNLNDRSLCSDCFHERGFNCENCGDETENSEGFQLSSQNSSGEMYCSDCASNLSQNQGFRFSHGRGNRSYSSNPQSTQPETSKYFPVSCITFETTRNLPVAFELEAENGDRDAVVNSTKAIDNGLGVCDDGSLNDSGVEVQIPPSIEPQRLNLLKIACEGLKAIKYEPTTSCGLHIHIGVGELKPELLRRIFLTFWTFEPLLLSLIPKKRRSNHYCKPLRSLPLATTFLEASNLSPHVLDAVLYLSKTNLTPSEKRSVESEKSNKYNSARYYGINLHSYFYRKTVEVRYHSGSLDPEKINNWARLCLSILELARSPKWDENSMRHYMLKTAELEYPAHSNASLAKQKKAVASLVKTLALALYSPKEAKELSKYYVKRFAKHNHVIDSEDTNTTANQENTTVEIEQ